jgi:hypothetical protein
MNTGMAWPTNPNATAEIHIRPVMVDKLHWPVSVAKLATLISWVRPFIFNPTELFFKPSLPNTMLPHVIASRFAHFLTIFCDVFSVRLPLAIFTLIANAIRPSFVIVEATLGQFALAAVADSIVVFISNAPSYSHAFSRACPSFVSVRRWHLKVSAAYSALFCDRCVVPRVLGCFSIHT